jgi:hypothetical protein
MDHGGANGSQGRLSRTSSRKRSERPVASTPKSPPEKYRVGPGRPPREFQFKPGQSGNPKGAKRKTSSITPDLKASLEHALGKKVTLTQGDTERIVTKAEAGMEQLVNQFARGDRYARRDLMVLAGALGVDLAAGQGQAIENALEAAVTANDAALVANFLHRHGVRDDASDAGLPASNDQEEPDGSEPGETTI